MKEEEKKKTGSRGRKFRKQGKEERPVTKESSEKLQDIIRRENMSMRRS